MLEIKNLTSGYGRKKSYREILTDINLQIDNGDFICLSGPNGSGKSTFMNSIANIKNDDLIISENSKIIFNNTNLFELSRMNFAKNISFLIQNEQSIWDYKVFDYILTGRFCYTDFFSNYSQKDKNKVQEIISLLKIENLQDRNINTLSGGEFQKVRIARTFVQDTPIILLDEPAGSLDFNFRFSILQIIKSFAKEKNKIVITTIHDLNLASIFADKIILMNNEKFYYDIPNKIITPKILQEIYGNNFGVFIHPEFNCVQLYPQFVLNHGE